MKKMRGRILPSGSIQARRDRGGEDEGARGDPMEKEDITLSKSETKDFKETGSYSAPRIWMA